VVIFDADGNYITQFGSGGMLNGQFDEPVGIAVDADGNVFVADTWNYRIQVFTPDETGLTYSHLRGWSVDGWTSQSAQNKPFLSLDTAGNVYVTDPENFRVLEFEGDNGKFIQGWGQYSGGIDGLGMPVGITTDAEGHVWVVDAANNRVLRFSPVAYTWPTAASLPAFPNSSIALNYDPNLNQLVDALGQPFYTLDITGSIWIPVIPDSISSTFTETVTPEVDDLGFWYIKDASGVVLYQWNEGALMWLPIETTISTGN
jgi:DNA-binding beta-propeller fold protein YncE